METNLLGHRSPAFPTTVGNARVLSRSILQDRAEHQPWRAISAKMFITRVECIRLAHALPEVVEEIKAARTAP